MKNISQQLPKREFIFIHGYTGSTSDFNGLPELLGRKFSAKVSCPLLPGHGTTVDDLIGLTQEDLFSSLELQIKDAVVQGKHVVLIGLSMGAQVALYMASKYKVRGVIAIAVTHQFKFPLNLSLVGHIGLLKRHWKKRYTMDENFFHAQNKNIFYDEMLSDGWFIARKLRTLVANRAHHIDQPVLFIHSANERLADPSAIATLSKMITGHSTVKLLRSDSHNIFYSSAHNLASTHIISFIDEVGLFQESPENVAYREKVTAIIPAYDEGLRIEKVLTTLSQIPFIDEIIVVDDGSNDDTASRVRAFHGVTLIENERNIGKAGSMERGVARARNDVIFFCDADLRGFRREHVEAIISPVLEGSHDMYIGMRGNFMQRAVRLWGLNSGERALRKHTWNTLPNFYKHRYRVEAGLNRHVKECGQKGMGWKIFDYTQPIKESKYGIIRGTILRLWMNVDVATAYVAYPLIKLISFRAHQFMGMKKIETHLTKA